SNVKGLIARDVNDHMATERFQARAGLHLLRGKTGDVVGSSRLRERLTELVLEVGQRGGNRRNHNSERLVGIGDGQKPATRVVLTRPDAHVLVLCPRCWPIHLQLVLLLRGQQLAQLLLGLTSKAQLRRPTHLRSRPLHTRLLTTRRRVPSTPGHSQASHRRNREHSALNPPTHLATRTHLSSTTTALCIDSAPQPRSMSVICRPHPCACKVATTACADCFAIEHICSLVMLPVPSAFPRRTSRVSPSATSTSTWQPSASKPAPGCICSAGKPEMS